MPTENRSSNTEMVSVPRDLVARVSSADIGMSAKKDRHQAAFELRTRLASSPSQPHPEPIAWMVGTAIWWTKEEAERDAAAMGLPVVGLGPMTGSEPAQQHQGEPVAWYRESCGSKFLGFNPSHPDCQPLYPHADPAEVERLRTELDLRTQEREKFLGWCRDARAESTKLRAKLAERDALLENALDVLKNVDDLDWAGEGVKEDIERALSASAEPSAPVEIDERPKGCCCPPKGYNGVWAAGPCPVHQGLRKLGQARAALDRKPS